MSKKAADYREKLAGTHHAHGCIRCHLRYVDACSATKEDGLCSLCKTNGERRQPWWPEGWLPVECCVESSRKLDASWAGDRQIMAAMKLAGLHGWWLCESKKGGCARTFPYDPRKDYRPAVTPDEWKRS